MALGEFELIRRYFDRPAGTPAVHSGVRTGVGDDCAVLAPRPGHDWLVSTDMLVEGRHFLPTVAPERLGHKALAVNLSDLAACGATPRAFFLALSLPRAAPDWLQGFASGLLALADSEGIVLAGGDTTAGPLNVCITVMGDVPQGQALLRSGARAGDSLWVSGRLGDARLALEAFRGTLALDRDDFQTARDAMERPQPRLDLGQALRGVASSAIDLSDGLLGDLAHVLRASGVGATVELAALPRSDTLRRQPENMQRLCLLAGGDDYELLFTAPPGAPIEALAAALPQPVAVTRIGQIEAAHGLRCRDAEGRLLEALPAGFDHFAPGS